MHNILPEIEAGQSVGHAIRQFTLQIVSSKPESGSQTYLVGSSESHGFIKFSPILNQSICISYRAAARNPKLESRIYKVSEISKIWHIGPNGNSL